MKILSLELKNFRNYSYASVDFDDGLNVLYGRNASGKTNMIESVYLASLFKSPRTTKDKELIKIGESKANVKLIIQKKFSRHTVNLQIDDSGKKKVAVDNIPVNRAGELLGTLGAVFFSPDELKLVKDAPNERRRFLDVGLSQQQKSYFLALQRYNKTLKQKNNLLKDYKFSQNIDDMLDVWDSGLAKEGAIIISKRTEYTDTLDSAAKRFHAELSENKEELSLSYESFTDAHGKETSDLEKEMLNMLIKAREKDKSLGYSTIGPHRDDIKIEINGKDSRKYASQGQQRTIALAMKLGEVLLYKNEIGEPPVLLLDDVLSELDENRQKLLLKLTSGFQTIITCTEYNLSVPALSIEVENGTVKQKMR